MWGKIEFFDFECRPRVRTVRLQLEPNLPAAPKDVSCNSTSSSLNSSQNSSNRPRVRTVRPQLESNPPRPPQRCQSQFKFEQFELEPPLALASNVPSPWHPKDKSIIFRVRTRLPTSTWNTPTSKPTVHGPKQIRLPTHDAQLELPLEQLELHATSLPPPRDQKNGSF